MKTYNCVQYTKFLQGFSTQCVVAFNSLYPLVNCIFKLYCEMSLNVKYITRTPKLNLSISFFCTNIQFLTKSTRIKLILQNSDDKHFS